MSKHIGIFVDSRRKSGGAYQELLYIIKNFEKPKGFIARKLSSSIQDPVDKFANILEEKSMWQKFGL